MGHLDVQRVSRVLPDGRVLFADVGGRRPSEGTVVREGGVGVVRRFGGAVRDDTTVRDLLVSLAPPAVRAAGEVLEAAGLARQEVPGPVRAEGRVARAR